MASLCRATVLCLVLGLGLPTGQAWAELSPSASIGEGMVVEIIPAENVLEKSGVLPGDVFHSWQRQGGETLPQPTPPAGGSGWPAGSTTRRSTGNAVTPPSARRSASVL